VESLAAEAHLSEDARFAIQVCVEEVLSNLIIHGRPQASGKDIEIETRFENANPQIAIADRCIPFDLTNAGAIDVAIAGRRVGGSGIRLINEFTSELSYISTSSGNELVMSFCATPETSEPMPGAQAPRPPDTELIRRIPVLVCTPQSALQKLVRSSTEESFDAGQLIIRQSDTDDTAIIVLDGTVAVVNESKYGRTLLARSTAPLLLGEIGALAKIPRTASVIADTRVRTLRISRDLLLEICQSTPEILQSVIGRLGEQIQRVHRVVGLCANGLKALERADFDAAIIEDLKNPNVELLDFAEAFRNLAKRITLERRQRSEMASAALIQQSMLPHSLEHLDPRGRCEVFGRMKSAREVGGDFYDAFMLDDHRMALVIGDVCGKGIPASLFMCFAVTVIRAMARQEQEVASLIAHVNNMLHAQNAASMFTTLFYGVLDLKTGRFEYSNCGHCSPLLLRQSGSCVELEGGGTPLGIFSERRTASHLVYLDQGDTILLFTDGVTDSQDLYGDQYGMHRLTEALSGVAGWGAAAIAEMVMVDVAKFHNGTEQFDDITCLAGVLRQIAE
jgi:serine phosphatase RsbU (regulator of sigma subunit)/anti-sigma regulatory factor (Ser/Thr protein kinase)